MISIGQTRILVKYLEIIISQLPQNEEKLKKNISVLVQELSRDPRYFTSLKK